MQSQLKIVYFDQYCHLCKHENKREDEKPCRECLHYPVNENSHKPVKYESKG